MFLLKWAVNEVFTSQFIFGWGISTETLRKKMLKNNYILDTLMLWKNIFWEEILIQRWLSAQNFGEVYNCLSPDFPETRISETKLLMLFFLLREVTYQGEWGREGGETLLSSMRNIVWSRVSLKGTCGTSTAQDSLRGRKAVAVISWAFLSPALTGLKSLAEAINSLTFLACANREAEVGD